MIHAVLYFVRLGMEMGELLISLEGRFAVGSGGFLFYLGFLLTTRILLTVKKCQAEQHTSKLYELAIAKQLKGTRLRKNS